MNGTYGLGIAVDVIVFEQSPTAIENANTTVTAIIDLMNFLNYFFLKLIINF